MDSSNRTNKSIDASLDDFWNIEDLLPKKKAPAAPSLISHSAKQIETTEIEFEAGKQQETLSVITSAAIPTGMVSSSSSVAKSEPPTPELIYSPLHPLIRQVRIYPWRSNFRFYERFCTIAAQLHERHGAPCEAVPFFSYMPQYDQMTRAQLSWYLYWRDCVRRGEYPDTDYSYIFLYLFEIINLPDLIPPAEGQILLCNLWKRYRNDYPLLNRYLAEWICDYSLLHQLPPPGDRLADCLPLIAEQSTLKEFYACPNGNDAHKDAYVYLTFCTNYDYHKSKLYLAGPAQAEAMDRHIPSAISTALAALNEDHAVFATTKMQKATLCRDTFIGALCSARMKRRIEIDYYSFQRSHELRFFITDIIKYTENRLRQAFGMKSRLSIYGLSDDIKKILNAYYAKVLPTRHFTNDSEAERPAYEALYDLPSTPMSIEAAQKIERSSWDVTQQLVEAFNDAPIEEPQPQTLQSASPNEPVDNLNIFTPYVAFLQAVVTCDCAGQMTAAKEKGLLPDAIADEINTLAVEQFGDILIEPDDAGGYIVIEDYCEEISTILKGCH